jgi:hypothetical protein
MKLLLKYLLKLFLTKFQSKEKVLNSWAWCLTHVIPAIQEVEKKVLRFKTSLGKKKS